MFKVPASLLELKRINCGLFYGYSQIGKCVTVYPRSSGETTELAAAIHSASVGLPHPAVPFERPCFRGSHVYRRYGAFASLFEDAVPAIRDPGGELVEDRRDRAPDWVPPDPFGQDEPRARRRAPSRLSTQFRAYEAISQRGKGGVYRAIDVRSGVRACILKEGRRHGEVDWDGTDGRDRVKHEANALTSLCGEGVRVPEVYASFLEGGHAYLVLEALPGPTLAARAVDSHAKLSINSALDLGRGCAELVDSIHRAGWIWRDCKPQNLLLGADGRLCPLDFEGSVRTDASPSLPWGTAGYLPPEWNGQDTVLGPVSPAQDLYALGAVLHAILAGTPPSPTAALRPIGVHRRGIPRAVRQAVDALVSVDPARRPEAAAVARTLARAA